MKLLHKVVKSSQGIQVSGVVSIDNTVVVKQRLFDENTDTQNLTQDDITQQIAIREQELVNKYNQMIKQLDDNKEQIIRQAKEEATGILQSARLESVSIKEQARQQGYAEGFENGKAEALNQLNSSMASLTKLINDLNSERESIYIDNENDLLDTVYELTRKITQSEIKTDREIIFSIVKQACKSFRNSDYLKISLAKCDVSESVVTDEKLIKRIAGNIPEVEIELLSDAQSGTVILDNDSEIVDASVNTQLDFLKEVLNASKKANQ